MMTQDLQAARWYTQLSSTSGDEALWPGRHKTFAELELDRLFKTLPETALVSKSGNSTYKCIRDANRLNIEYLDYKIPINMLRHVTGEFAGRRIVKDGGFRGLRKQIGTVWSDQNYSWWSVHYSRDELWRETAEITAEMVSDYNLHRKGFFEPSNPFMDTAYREKYAFFYSFDYLLTEYKNQFCFGDEDPILRILGTFVYKQEIMHTVVVHALESNDLFRHLPEVTDSGNRIFFQESDGLFYWCPESIIYQTTFPWSPWERLSVAFHLPEDYSLLRTEDLVKHRDLVQN